MSLATRAWAAGLVAGLMTVALGQLLAPAAASMESPGLLLGTAKRELDVPAGTPLAGYSRRRGKPSTGIHDAPSVRALVLRGGGEAVALVSCDLLIIDELLYRAVRERLAGLRLQPEPQLLIAATHTHSGPGAYGRKFVEKISMGHFDPEVFERLVTRIVEAIAEAAQRLAPASLAWAAGSAEALIANRMVEGGAVDAEVSVLAFRDGTGQLRAAVVGFAAHPTTLGAWNRELSADYPGVVAAALEARYPGSVCLFFSGAVGDQAPAKQGEGLERARFVGDRLAAEVEALLTRSGATAMDGGLALSVRRRELPLDRARVRLGSRLALPGWLSRALVDDDATLTLIAVGRVLLLGVPCDLSAELGLSLKARARELGYRPVIVGFANDYVGYCLPERVYHSDHYEALMSFNGPRTGERLVEELTQMMQEFARGQVTRDR